MNGKLYCKVKYDDNGKAILSISTEYYYAQESISSSTSLINILYIFMEIHQIPKSKLAILDDSDNGYQLYSKVIPSDMIQLSGKESLREIADKVKLLYEKFWEIIKYAPEEEEEVEFEL